MKPTLITITGPSCSGKSTLEGLLKERLGYVSILSTTTRAPRPGEVNGQHYHFIDEDTFTQKEKAGDFIESVLFPGGRYAASAAEVQSATAGGQPVVIVVEIEGAKQIAQYCEKHDWNLVRAFVDAPVPMLMERWLERYQREIQGITAPDKMKAVTQRYAMRLANYVTNESIWRDQMTLDIVVESFDPSTQENVIAQINSVVTHQLRRQNENTVQTEEIETSAPSL